MGIPCFYIAHNGSQHCSPFSPFSRPEVSLGLIGGRRIDRLDQSRRQPRVLRRLVGGYRQHRRGSLGVATAHSPGGRNTVLGTSADQKPWPGEGVVPDAGFPPGGEQDSRRVCIDFFSSFSILLTWHFIRELVLRPQSLASSGRAALSHVLPVHACLLCHSRVPQWTVSSLRPGTVVASVPVMAPGTY